VASRANHAGAPVTVSPYLDGQAGAKNEGERPIQFGRHGKGDDGLQIEENA
jgi:hypothetical protein